VFFLFICFVFLVKEEMSGLRMLRRPFMGSAFKAKHVARASVNWNRLIFRYSDEKKKVSLSALQSKWADIQSLHSALPRDVKTIDWNYWRKTIKTPGVVDEFKKRYETEISKQVKVSESDMSRRALEYQQEVKAAEELAGKSDGNIAELEKEIEGIEWEKENIDKLDLEWYYKKNPGSEEYFQKEADEAMWFTDPDMEKLETIDFKELRKQLNQGNVRALAALSFAKFQNTSFGPYKDMGANNADDVVKTYQNSPVWIAHQIEQQDKQD